MGLSTLSGGVLEGYTSPALPTLLLENSSDIRAVQNFDIITDNTTNMGMDSTGISGEMSVTENLFLSINETDAGITQEPDELQDVEEQHTSFRLTEEVNQT